MTISFAAPIQLHHMALFIQNTSFQVSQDAALHPSWQQDFSLSLLTVFLLKSIIWLVFQYDGSVLSSAQCWQNHVPDDIREASILLIKNVLSEMRQLHLLLHCYALVAVKRITKK